MKSAFIVLLILITFYNIGSVVVSSWPSYSSHDYWQRFPSLKQSYLDSQYANKHSKAWIPDQIALAYAGGAFVRGVNPVLIIADTPPLGKYLIGFSAVLFDNEYVTSLFFCILSLFILYLLGKEVFKSTQIALLAPVFLSFEPIFKNQLVYSPLLDNIQLAFLLGSFYFFDRVLSNKKVFLNFLVANVFLGLFISTKFYITGITIIMAQLLVLLVRRGYFKILLYFLTLPISIFILFLTYIRIFAFGYSLRSLFGIQKYIFLYHKSQLILPFSIWPLLLLNRWYVWFGNKMVITDSQWQITWPIITIISLITIFFYLLKKLPRNINVEVLMAWSIFYILFFSFGQITSRYLIIYIPVLYIISVYGLKELTIALKKRI